MSARRLALLVVLSPLPVGVAGAAEEGAAGAPAPVVAPRLHRNPFERPVLAKAAPREVARPVPAPPPWTPLLKATMVSEDGRSLANVDGRLVQEGEEYQGHTLVEVREREAVFERAGTRWVLSLD